MNRDWKFVGVTQETNHKFLNLFIYHYEVDGKPYSYYVASRKSLEELRVKTSSLTPDGVILLLYKKDGDSISLLLTQEFRPAFGKVFTSVPAGLLEKGETIFEAAYREAKEEVGVSLSSLELLIPSSSNSEGLSDEMCAAVVGEIASIGENSLEGYEEISSSLYTLDEVRKMLDDPNRIFPLPGRILLELFLAKYSR